MTVDCDKQITNIPLFLFYFVTCSRDIIDMFPRLKKTTTTHTHTHKKNNNFLLDTIKARFFKHCTIIALLEVYIVFVHLLTLTLLKGLCTV